MSLLIEKYNEVIKTIGDINGQILNAKNEINALKKEQDNDIEIKISSLEDLSKKIDEYILKVQSFQLLAEKNLTSKNVLSIETPPEYRVNLNRLKNWSMLIDPNAKDDPYAQRVYVVAKCDEHFLKLKAKECEEKIDELKEIVTSTNYARIQQLENDIQELKAQLEKFVQSESIWTLCNKIVEDNYKYWFEVSPTTFNEDGNDGVCFAPGAYAAPLPVDEAQHEKLGRLYNVNLGEVLIPVEISLEKEFVLTISCAPSKDKQLDKGIQNLILNIVNNSPAGTQKVYVLDGLRFNTTSLGSLKKIENTFALEQVPRNQEQITATLESIVASFADIDDMLEDCESVKEYNGKVSKEKRIPLTTIVLYGWPKAYEGKNKELLTRIMTNYERYGVSIVTVTYKKAEPSNKEIEDNSLPEYATHNAIHIRMFPNDTTISLPDEKPQKFTWYVFEDELSDEYTESLKSFTITKEVIGNEYIKRYSLTEMPSYNHEDKRSIVLPFGVDGKDAANTISFDNENFAAYLMGASGSGKSTLLHTLITGIIRNYHPDDVELWLADFKMSEFSQYMDPLPPHVKYILLDESQELVYDLLDRLTEKMMERQRFFMKHRDLKKVENVPADFHMPVIFVILDEFSIMSQVVAESDTYRLKLQNLLAKGRALGIKFIFASQTFSSGIVGLTETAKKQIQLRLAMKNTYGEIDDTLELSSITRTDQVKAMMDSLPPHYILVKRREGENQEFAVRKYKVMYFAGKGDEAYAPQRELIKKVRGHLTPITKDMYDPNNLGTYVEKEPVIVDGNSYKSFEECRNKLMDLKLNCQDNVEFTGEEVFVNIGSPRRMVSLMPIALVPESYDNMLLFYDYTELPCAASVINSVILSSSLQGKNVRVWSNDRNRIYRSYRGVWNSVSNTSSLETIAKEIAELRKKIENRESGSELIVLMGFERMCIDFSFLSEGLEISTPSEIDSLLAADGFVQTDDESGSIVDFLDSLDIDFIDVVDSKETPKVAPKVETEQQKHLEQKQDVLADFEYVIKNGSRLGYHFLFAFSSVKEFKQSGLKIDLFRHKISFRMSTDDSWEIFNSKIATGLPTHICQYSDSINTCSYRPYIYKNVTWDNWYIDEDGKVKND